jgi:hypothetical protein
VFHLAPIALAMGKMVLSWRCYCFNSHFAPVPFPAECTPSINKDYMNPLKRLTMMASLLAGLLITLFLSYGSSATPVVSANND